MGRASHSEVIPLQAPPQRSVRFPGIPATTDGSGVVAWVETHIAEIACAYPITPSSNMGSGFQLEVANGRRNLWDRPLEFLELESEHSSASTAEGAAAAGARVVNFTSGQGLILMKEVLYTISGKRLPVIFHIGARALTSQALNIHCGHDDVMGVADTGWGILFARNVQEAGDLALIARRVAEASETPFMVVQDGFLTTHTIESCRLPEPELMKEFLGDPREKIRLLLDPEFPIQIGVVQNQDAYMKGRVGQRAFTDRVMPAFVEATDEYARLTGRSYAAVDAHRLDDARVAVVAMGTLAETAQAVAYDLREREALPAGVLNITSFRPFPGPAIVQALRNARAIAVVERTDEPLSGSNPLAAAVKAAFADAVSRAPGYPEITHVPPIHQIVAGLGGRDVRPGNLAPVFRLLASEKAPARRTHVLGVHHEFELPAEPMDVRGEGAFAMRGHSVGGFGSVTTNKIIATVVGDVFGLNVQAYPRYGSEKKGLPTTYYLAAAPDPIRTHCEIVSVDFVAVNDAGAFLHSNAVEGLRRGGALFLASPQPPEQALESIPPWARTELRRQEAKVLVADPRAIAQECASRPELAVRMQGIVLLGVFLRAAPFRAQRGLSEAELWEAVEKALRKYFGRRGEAVVRDNLKAVRLGYERVAEVAP